MMRPAVCMSLGDSNEREDTGGGLDTAPVKRGSSLSFDSLCTYKQTEQRLAFETAVDG